MTINQLIAQIKKKQSFLCIGLDVDLEKIPKHLLDEEDPIFTFNKAIIDATHKYAVAYKPNIAFYEAHGLPGWKALEKTMMYLNVKHPEIFTVADAKRGDIGNTSNMYAKAFFEGLDFDSITVAPYMGRDSVEPFLQYKDKYAILLALTSNKGAFDFQTKKVGNEQLYQKVIKTSRRWKNAKNLMYVVGATKAKHLAEIRKIIPNRFLLIPGVGAQGGSLKVVCRYGMNKNVGLLVNSSRGIIYADSTEYFAEGAQQKAKEMQEEMAKELKKLNNK